MKHGSHVPWWGIYSEGGVSDPNNGNYTIEYYIKLKIDLSKMGVHSLAAEGVFVLLTPCAAIMMVLALREELPNIPLHITFTSSRRPPR